MTQSERETITAWLFLMTGTVAEYWNKYDDQKLLGVYKQHLGDHSEEVIG
ncbi:hypothetical protein [Tuberibacillus sp. Marseille-P3662]|nr:hypothetical protein [Tuberibacillus sp. Marseille-P3662]